MQIHKYALVADGKRSKELLESLNLPKVHVPPATLMERSIFKVKRDYI